MLFITTSFFGVSRSLGPRPWPAWRTNPSAARLIKAIAVRQAARSPTYCGTPTTKAECLSRSMARGIASTILRRDPAAPLTVPPLVNSEITEQNNCTILWVCKLYMSAQLARIGSSANRGGRSETGRGHWQTRLAQSARPVSYTHLTLPTILLV